MRIALAQINSVVGDVDDLLARIDDVREHDLNAIRVQR